MAETYKPKGLYLEGYTPEEIKELPAVIGTAEVARIARVSVRTVLREAAKGNIPGCFKFGSHWRFNKERVCEAFGQG